ncbi:hypothetical protein ACET3Z_005613 [Daucus carota]
MKPFLGVALAVSMQVPSSGFHNGWLAMRQWRHAGGWTWDLFPPNARHNTSELRKDGPFSISGTNSFQLRH